MRQKLIPQRLQALGGPWRNAQGNCQIALQMYNLPRESAKKSITIGLVQTLCTGWKGRVDFINNWARPRLGSHFGRGFQMGGAGSAWQVYGLLGEEREYHLWSSLCSHAGHGEVLSACYLSPPLHGPYHIITNQEAKECRSLLNVMWLVTGRRGI